MTTVAYANMRALADGWEHIFTSAVCSGICGDARHRAQGGYHESRDDNPAGNYSIIRPDDVAGRGPNDAAAAIDMSMSPADMKLATTRLIVVWSNPDDPRRKYLNAFNGWLGSGDAQRWDVVARARKWATPDHKWHVHLEVRRLWVLSAAMVKAVLSILRGETVAQYLASIGVTPIPTPAPAHSPAPAPRPAAPPYPGRVLKRNDQQHNPDPEVRLLQQQMIRRGWTSIGRADGYPGRKFDRTVRRWQQLCKLTVDGEVGPVTWPTPWTRRLGS